MLKNIDQTWFHWFTPHSPLELATRKRKRRNMARKEAKNAGYVRTVAAVARALASTPLHYLFIHIDLVAAQ